MGIYDRVRGAWNAFVSSPETESAWMDYGAYGSAGSSAYSSYSPSTPRRRYSNERTIIASIYNRISMDVADVLFRHARLDEQGRYLEDVDSQLNSCLSIEPNLDQGPRALKQDIVLTMFDKGCAAVVPVDTTVDPQTSQVMDIFTLRVGEIVKWYPKHVKVSVYNEDKGVRQEITLEKRFVAIVENPLYSVMNEQNSTFQRLIRTLNNLDAVGEQSSSGKLDIIIQLPYVVKSESRKAQAEKRREELEWQLTGSKYGVAYADGTEKITQLNRPAENNLLKQVEYLVELLYSQLGITAEVMAGTADEATMINYQNRTVKPIAEAIKEAMQRSLLGPVKIKKRERILYFNDPFKLVPVGQIAEIADKFTRNEIFSSNEMRGFMGTPPSKDPKADELVNSNMPQPPAAPPGPPSIPISEMDSLMDEVLGGLQKDIEKLTQGAADE